MIITSRIGQLLKARAEDLKYDLCDISREAHCTYEYARRLLAGTSIPTTSMLVDIIEGLQFDQATAEKLLEITEQDREAHDHRRRATRSPNYPKLPGGPRLVK